MISNLQFCKWDPPSGRFPGGKFPPLPVSHAAGRDVGVVAHHRQLIFLANSGRYGWWCSI